MLPSVSQAVAVFWGELAKEAPDQGRDFEASTKVHMWSMSELEKVRTVQRADVSL